MLITKQEQTKLKTICEELGAANISLGRLIKYINEEEAFSELRAAFEHLHILADALDGLLISTSIMREES